MPDPQDFDPTDEAVETPSKPRTPPQPATPEPRQHSARLLSLAASVGIGADEAADYSTSELIEVVKAEQVRQAQADRQKPAPPAPETEPEYEPDLGDLFDPEVAAKLNAELKKLNGKHAEKYKALQAKIAKAEELLEKAGEAEKARQVEAYRQQVDRLFKGRPDLFGAQDFEDLDPRGKFFKRRVHIDRMMATLQGSLKQRFEEACETVYGERPAEQEDEAPPPPPARRPGPRKQAEDALQAERDRWERNGGTASPSGRKAPEIDDDTPRAREQKAAKEIRDIKRRRGIAVANGAGEEEDLLPE